MHEEDAEIRIPEHLIAQDEISIFVLQSTCAHDPREARNEHNDQCGYDRELPIVQDTDHDKGDQNTGEGIDRIHDTHDHLVDHSPDIAARKTQQNTDPGRQQNS